MAVLSDNDRHTAFGEFISDICAAKETLGAATKAELRAALNALDDYLNTNAAAINNAIPLPARTALTTAQKARLLNAVVRYRYIKGA